MKLIASVSVAATALVTLFNPSAGHAATRARTLAETVLKDSSARLSAGPSHTCQVNGDGTVRCWGFNGDGQLGDGTTTTRLTPVNVSGLTNAVAVTAGRLHTCALLADGTVRCWGNNALGQLGDATITARLTPVKVSSHLANGPTSVVAIAAGHDHTCALLSDSTAQCWGDNGSGQLGAGNIGGTQLTPVSVSGLIGAVAIAAGDIHACALLVDSSVMCWGHNGGGQVGDGTTITRPAPVTASDPSTNAVAITAGGFHTCALLAAGYALCWGGNKSGELGGDGPIGGAVLTKVIVSLEQAVTIAAGHDHTCALLAGGGPRIVGLAKISAQCWGANSFGQLGDGTTITPLGWAPVSDLDDAVAIAAGEAHTCALMGDGSARCWGSNFFGTLGNGTTSRSLTPTTVAGGHGSVNARDIAAGSRHTCAVRADGTVACWGDNGSGQLGDGTTTTRLTPVGVGSVAFEPISRVAIAAGRDHTCALLDDGSAQCWGDNGSGQLGDGTIGGTQLTPVRVGALTKAVAIAAGEFHTCALIADGGVECWGKGYFGQLGNGTTIDRHSATSVSNLTNAVAIAAGEAHTCALLADSSMRCWGFGGSGQFGDGTSGGSQLVPGGVTGLYRIVAIAAGNVHTCALIVNGSVKCWGFNGSGQLGDGTTTTRLFPVIVSGITNAVAIAAGEFHTCALLADGSARCWGDNSTGQLGDGTTTDRPAPTEVTISFLKRTLSGGVVAIVPLVNLVRIATGRRHTCAILADGSVRCWGENAFGQIGSGTTFDQLRPVPVPSFR